MKEIKTLQEFADYINEHEDWALDMFDIIESNGWTDETGEEFGVYNDGKERIVINDNNIAIVIGME